MPREVVKIDMHLRQLRLAVPKVMGSCPVEERDMYARAVPKFAAGPSSTAKFAVNALRRA